VRERGARDDRRPGVPVAIRDPDQRYTVSALVLETPTQPERSPRALGDVERHQEELGALWGGAICVAQRPPYRWTGEQVRDVFFGSGAAEPRAAGVWAIDGRFPGTDRPGRSSVDVLVLDGVTQRWVDERFGVGEVTLRGLLEPAA